MAEKKLRDKLDEISKTLSEIKEWLAGHTETHKTIDRDIEDFRDCLFGDNPGLKSKVEKLWECKKQIVSTRQFWMGIVQWLIKITIAAAAGAGLIMWKGS